MICTVVVSLKVRAAVNEKRLSTRNNSLPARAPQLPPIESIVRIACHPPPEKCQGETQGADAGKVFSLTFSTILLACAQLCNARTQIILSCPIMDISVILGYCWLIKKYLTLIS